VSTAAIQALINRGIAVNQLHLQDGDHVNRTPLHVIAGLHWWCAAFRDSANMLINVCGVDLEALDAYDNTCIQFAAAASHEALRFFIDAGADVNTVNINGQTPLHRVRSYECTVLLLAAGADLNARNREGRTAFESEGTQYGWNSILPVFLAAGADPNNVESIAAYVADRVENARRDIAKTRLDFVRQRATQVCIGLQSLDLDALRMCEIMQHACGPLAQLIAFHQWWKIATTVKHFHPRIETQQ
jgi:ankyrin repeat protein